MPDIFGKNQVDYSHYNALENAGNDVTSYIASRAERLSVNPHDFNALGTADHTAAAQDAQATLGYLTNNLEAMSAVVEMIIYDNYSLNELFPINTNIPRGATTYSKRVLDGYGMGRFVDDMAGDAPGVGIEQTKQSWDLYEGAAIASWGERDIEGAMFSGLPLETSMIEEGVNASLRHIDEVGLKGDVKRGLTGLTNLAAAANPTGDQVKLVSVAKTIAASTGDEIIELMRSNIGAIIEDTVGILGRNIQADLGVYLPISQYNKVVSTPRAPENDKSIWTFVQESNPWSILNGRAVSLHAVPDLKGAGASNVDRMVIAVKSPRVFEMAVQSMPMLYRIDHIGLRYNAYIRYCIGGLEVMRPLGVRYVDSV